MWSTVSATYTAVTMISAIVRVLLQSHDQVEPHDPGADDHQRDDHERRDLGAVTVAPAESLEDRRGGQRRERDEHGLPADVQDVGHHAGQGVAGSPERRA
jgi:hypothetical protein